MDTATLFEALQSIPDQRTKKGQRLPLTAILAIWLGLLRFACGDVVRHQRFDGDLPPNSS